MQEIYSIVNAVVPMLGLRRIVDNAGELGTDTVTVVDTVGDPCISSAIFVPAFRNMSLIGSLLK
jgi:hypothetical protein